MPNGLFKALDFFLKYFLTWKAELQRGKDNATTVGVRAKGRPGATDSFQVFLNSGGNPRGDLTCFSTRSTGPFQMTPSCFLTVESIARPSHACFAAIFPQSVASLFITLAVSLAGTKF